MPWTDSAAHRRWMPKTLTFEPAKSWSVACYYTCPVLAANGNVRSSSSLRRDPRFHRAPLVSQVSKRGGYWKVSGRRESNPLFCVTVHGHSVRHLTPSSKGQVMSHTHGTENAPPKTQQRLDWEPTGEEEVVGRHLSNTNTAEQYEYRLRDRRLC